MPRANYSYTQLVIGDCGHLCQAWPIIADLGGANPKVVCEDCTAELYGLEEHAATGIAVWVRVKEKPESTKKKSKPRAKKAPKPNMWDQFLPGTK